MLRLRSHFFREDGVDQLRPEPVDGEVTAPDPRPEWIKPQVSRIIAGGAEAAGDTSTDGIDILS